MGEIGTLVDLLLFYTVERELFNNLVIGLGKNSQEVKTTIALWIMLQEIGSHDLIRRIHSENTETIEALFNESLQCLRYMKPNAGESFVLHRTTAFKGLFLEILNNYGRDFMYRRYIHIMETVCSKIFGENAAIEVDESGTRPVVRPFGHGSFSHVLQPTGAKGVSGEAEAVKESNLNPEASEFFPGKTLEDARTMFLTFSKGHPLTSEEIFNFFTSKFGQVVQDVFIEHPPTGQDPRFGRIVFTTSTVIPRVLNGLSTAKFLVNRKHLWARIYMNRRGAKKKMN